METTVSKRLAVTASKKKKGGKRAKHLQSVLLSNKRPFASTRVTWYKCYTKSQNLLNLNINSGLNNMCPILKGNLFSNPSSSVCFEGLEMLATFIYPAENNATIGKGIKISCWHMLDFLQMLHELWGRWAPQSWRRVKVTLIAATGVFAGMCRLCRPCQGFLSNIFSSWEGPQMSRAILSHDCLGSSVSRISSGHGVLHLSGMDGKIYVIFYLSVHVRPPEFCSKILVASCHRGAVFMGFIMCLFIVLGSRGAQCNYHEQECFGQWYTAH